MKAGGTNPVQMDVPDIFACGSGDSPLREHHLLRSCNIKTASVPYDWILNFNTCSITALIHKQNFYNYRPYHFQAKNVLNVSIGVFFFTNITNSPSGFMVVDKCYNSLIDFKFWVNSSLYFTFSLKKLWWSYSWESWLNVWVMFFRRQVIQTQRFSPTRISLGTILRRCLRKSKTMFFE